MTGGKRTKELRRNESIERARALPVSGVARVDFRPSSAYARECESNVCELGWIKAGDPFVRVLYANSGESTDRPAETFHEPCYRWEFEA